MRVVVTGATGNVGTTVVEHLLATRDDVEVVGVARRVPSAAVDDAYAGRLTWAGLDLSDDACRPALRVALRGAAAVVHLAWGFQPSHDPDYLESLGVGGTRRVLESATAERVPHLVHMSSVGAYSPKTDDLPVAESYPARGIRSSMYSRHKAAAESLLDDHEAPRRLSVDDALGLAQAGAVLSRSLFRDSGQRAVDVEQGGQTLQSAFKDHWNNHGAPESTFVFTPGYGQDVINLFRVDGSDHDSLSFKGSDFGTDPASQLATILANTQDARGGVVITDPTTKETVQLLGISAAKLTQNQGDFTFHA